MSVDVVASKNQKFVADSPVAVKLPYDKPLEDHDLANRNGAYESYSVKPSTNMSQLQLVQYRNVIKGKINIINAAPGAVGIGEPSPLPFLVVS